MGISPLQILTCGHGQHTTSDITPHYCYHNTRLGYNGVSLYMSVYHTTYPFHLHTPSPDSHLRPWSTYYITYHTTLLLSHYTFGLQWGIIVYVCIPYHLHIPSSNSHILSPLQILTCGHGQRATSHITPHHCYHTTRLGYNGVSLYMSVYHTTYTFHLHTPSSDSHLWPWSTYYITPHHCYYTTRLGYNGVSLYISVYHTTYTFHLHTPSSYLLSRFSPVATVNVPHHMSHHTTVITLHVWVTMGYHCIYLYTIPPTHSTFTLPPLISSPGSHLWPRSTYYITPHHCYYTTRLCYNGVSLYISVYHTTYTFHLHTPSSYLLSRFSPVAMVNVLHHISHHTTVITLHVWVTLYISVYHATYTFHLHTPSSYLLSRFSPVAMVNVLHHISHHTTVITLHVCITCIWIVPFGTVGNTL